MLRTGGFHSRGGVFLFFVQFLLKQFYSLFDILLAFSAEIPLLPDAFITVKGFYALIMPVAALTHLVQKC